MTSPPDIINEEEEYKVEEVQNHWKWKCDIQFLIYWKGYENKHDQWIAETLFIEIWSDNLITFKFC